MYPLNVSLPAPAIGFACANDEIEHEALTAAGYMPALIKAESVAAAMPDDDQSTSTKAELMAALDAAGIDYDKRLGVEKLRALLP